MPIVTSKDGTKIVFDKVGSGPAIILVNGAISYRALDPTLGQIAELLSDDFTVYNYDRRGRGESGDTKPFTKQHEIEDIQALLDHAGGTAVLLGFSSGSAVALDTAAVTPGIKKVLAYEAPFIVDDSRSPVPDDYAEQLAKLSEQGDRDGAAAYFMRYAFGMPEDQIEGMKQDKATWSSVTGTALTIAYDAAFVGSLMRGKPLPADRWADVTIPVLVMEGGDSEAWMHHAADALAKVLPNATRKTLPGQTHAVDPQVLVPVVEEFLKS